MESQPACRQRCRMHPVPWRDNSKGLRGHAGVKHMRNLSHRAGGTTEVRSIHERQDVCELSSSTHLRGAPEGGPGRQVITIYRRRLLATVGRRIRGGRVAQVSILRPGMPLPYICHPERRSPSRPESKDLRLLFILAALINKTSGSSRREDMKIAPDAIRGPRPNPIFASHRNAANPFHPARPT